MASTIQVDKITDIGGNTIVSSNGSGTFTSNLPSNVSSATGTLPIANGGTGATTLAAAGLANTPAFEAWSNADQAVNDNTTTKVQCKAEVYDTAGAYDNSSTYRFTPQTAGKYFCYGQVFFESSSFAASKINQATAYIYKNGAVVGASQNNFKNNPIQQFNSTVSTVIDMNGSSDYIELYGYFDGDSINGVLVGQTTYRRTMFGAYKVIGA